jgi:hypothetical protein
MKALQTATFVAITILLFLTGSIANPAFGRTQPVYDIVDKPIVTGSGNMLSMDQVEGILRGSAETKGWTVQKIEEGHLLAQIDVRQHYAAVDMNFDTTMYSIIYNDSEVLKYDGIKIHRNYNKWITLIERIADERFLIE